MYRYLLCVPLTCYRRSVSLTLKHYTSLFFILKRFIWNKFNCYNSDSVLRHKMLINITFPCTAHEFLSFRYRKGTGLGLFSLNCCMYNSKHILHFNSYHVKRTHFCFIWLSFCCCATFANDLHFICIILGFSSECCRHTFTLGPRRLTGQYSLDFTF